MTDKDHPETPRSGRRLTRRQFLPGAAGVLAAGAAGVAGYELRGHSPAGSVSTDQAKTNTGATHTDSTTVTTQAQTSTPDPGPDYHHFVTEPDLHPPVITVSDILPHTPAANSPRFIALEAGFITSSTPGAPSGPLLVDRLGRIVWYKPLSGRTQDLKVQSYQGKPVLTWWHGHSVDYHDQGTAPILDGSYNTVATVRGVEGHGLGGHEIVITARDTALYSINYVVQVDLTSLGGPQNGRVLSSHVQEVDIATGKLLFDWDSLKHVPLSDSYRPYVPGQKGPYDFFHLNSIVELPDGSLLISSRHTSTIYAIDRSSGQIIWRMGGKHSDFQIDPNARFAFQHHPRPHSSSTLSLFDNGAWQKTTPNRSRGMIISYDLSTRRVSLVQEFLHPAKFNSWSQGSVQVLPSGEVLVGWGAQPYYSTHKSDGTMLTDGGFPIGRNSYRAFLVDWVGRPTGQPAVAAKVSPAGGFIVYASWNGATEIATWTVLAGKDKTSLQPVGTQAWAGFETAISVNSEGPAFQVVAHDSNGNELGRSAVV